MKRSDCLEREPLWLHTNAVAREKSHGIRKDWWKRAQEETHIHYTTQAWTRAELNCLLPKKKTQTWTRIHAPAHTCTLAYVCRVEHCAHRDYIDCTIVRHVCCV